MSFLFDFLTLDHVDLSGKKVLVRVDINSPVDPKTNTILDPERILATLPTLKALEDAAVVLTSHQSRPGKKDYLTLESHVKILRKRLKRPIKYVDDVMGPTALNAIKSVKPGEILVLQNLRFAAEENLDAPPEVLIQTHLVRRLTPLFDFFVNDAFPAIHRSQPSIVGFAWVLPTIAGRSMEEELTTLREVTHYSRRPFVFLIGGTKIRDKFDTLSYLVSHGRADRVLLTGKLANVFLKANGYLIRDPDLIPHSRLEWEICEVTREYRSRLKLPLDVATELNGKRIEWHVSELEAEITAWDIGPDTVERYAEILQAANTIAANGPAGVFERPPFDWGTRELLKILADSPADVLIGGGHLAAAAHQMKLEKQFKHISTGGGAMTAVLAGQELPALTALRRSAEQLLEKGVAKRAKNAS